MSRMTEIMTERAVVLEQLLVVSHTQLKLVRGNDIASLLQLLARKQQFLDNLESCERALDPFRSIEAEKRKWDTDTDKDNCSVAMQKCNDLLKQILELDKTSETELAVMKDQTQARIQNMESGGRAANAYAKQDSKPYNATKISNNRFDFKSE